jgi:secondary thiamine-phosphate synthase enzyme
LKNLVEGVSEGLALFYIPHTTASLLINEDDPELRQDFVKIVENWLEEYKPFAHIKNNNPNTEAHVYSAFGGSRLLVAIINGELDLGKYQNILLLEMDGPKQREIRCKFIIG